MNDFDFNDEPNELRDVQPSSFRHVIGQENAKAALQIAVDYSFQARKKADDLLLSGPPGLGKSALVSVLASELAVPFTEVLAQSVASAAELNSVLLSASDGILFLDEIHLLSAVNQHALLQVLDKRRIFLGGKSVQSIPVAEFTLVGATTDLDGVIQPLQDRFKMVLHLDYYSEDELAEIVRQRCGALGWNHEPELLHEIAKRGRQTPRIALRLLQSAMRVSVAEGAGSITIAHLERGCQIERVSSSGLDNLQQQYVRLLGSGPIRLNVLASMLGVSSTKVLTKTCEPFLLRSGMIVKDGGVRSLTQIGQEHLAEMSSILV